MPVPIDRAVSLARAAEFVRDGNTTSAIEEYVRLLDEYPRDWSTANVLGDVYVRAGQLEDATTMFVRIGDGLRREGFLARAGAVYKKVLKLQPDHDVTLLRSAELAASQGLLADARSYWRSVAERRRTSGDRRGVLEITVRLASIDPDDVQARMAGARARLELQDVTGGLEDCKRLAAYLVEKGRRDEAIRVLEDALALYASNGQIQEQLLVIHARLARGAVARGDFAAASEFVSEQTAGNDPTLLLMLAEARLRAGDVDAGLVLARRVIQAGVDRWGEVVSLGVAVAEQGPKLGFRVVELVVDAAMSGSDWPAAVSALQAFLARLPGHVPGLTRLVEVGLAGRLEDVACAAKCQLADAYGAAGAVAEAIVLAEDLIAREPWEPDHLDRFRRLLALSGVAEPDAVIAQRLGGEPAFTTVVTVSTPGEPIPAMPHRTTDEGGPPPGASPENIEDVFAGLRESVTAGSPDEIRAESLYRCALALIEGGEVAEAVTALEAAARSPRLRFVTSARVARIHRGRGDAQSAVEWFERAAEAPPATVEDGRLVLYELAELLESLGQGARALAVCIELQAEAGDFRDVAVRIDRLARAQARGTP